jgi:hypothetical protein
VIEHASQLVELEESDATGGEEDLETASARRAGAEDAHHGETSSRFEYAPSLAQGARRVPELVEGTAADGPGEAGVGERKVMSIRPGERGSGADPSSAAGGLFEHGGGDVYAEYFATVARCEAARVEAGGASEVQVPVAAFHADEAGDYP